MKKPAHVVQVAEGRKNEIGESWVFRVYTLETRGYLVGNAKYYSSDKSISVLFYFLF